MKKLTLWMLGAVVALGCTLVTPRTADAAFRLGADAIWVPMAFHDIDDGDATRNSDHELASFAGAVHGNLGFDVFSIGGKINYFNSGVAFEAGDTRLEELDINLMLRFGIPTTDVAVFAEGGLSTNPGLDFAGFNGGGGVEYAIFGLPTLDFNVGLMGQYVNVSELDLTINGEDEEGASLNEGRAMLYFGVDFGL